MERSLLDTDIFSEVLKGKDAMVVSAAEQYLAIYMRFTISIFTITEIVDGLRRKRRDARIEALQVDLAAEALEVLPLTMETATLAGLIFGDLHRSGQPLGQVDPFIAAIAIHAAIPLVTGNTSHFELIQGLGYPLKLANWRQPASPEKTP